jgi:hypothetical protein
MSDHGRSVRVTMVTLKRHHGLYVRVTLVSKTETLWCLRQSDQGVSGGECLFGVGDGAAGRYFWNTATEEPITRLHLLDRH